MTKNKMGAILITSSIVMLICVFTMSYRMLGIGLLQWIVVLAIAMNHSFGKRFKIMDFAEHLGKETNQAWEEKKRFKASVYALVAPMICIGLAWVGIALFALIFLI